MERYVKGRRNDGTYIINLEKTWEKLQLAARLIVAVKHSQDIIVQTWRTYNQRAIMEFAHHTSTKLISERHIPGTFTNQAQKRFEEPCLIIVTDPSINHLSIKETTFAQIPVIAFCNTNCNLKNVDIAIPTNNNKER